MQFLGIYRDGLLEYIEQKVQWCCDGCLSYKVEILDFERWIDTLMENLRPSGFY